LIGIFAPLGQLRPPLEISPQPSSPSLTAIMNLNQAEQNRLEEIMMKKQQKEFMRMFFRVTADCFDTCVTDFSSKVLSPREVRSCPTDSLTRQEACIAKCTDKFMKSSERIGLRFAEENQKLMEKGAGSFGG
jgi:mitochondrial import inner membrane translocase subunit TIM9